MHPAYVCRSQATHHPVRHVNTARERRHRSSLSPPPFRIQIVLHVRLALVCVFINVSEEYHRWCCWVRGFWGCDTGIIRWKFLVYESRESQCRDIRTLANKIDTITRDVLARCPFERICVDVCRWIICRPIATPGSRRSIEHYSEIYTSSFELCILI